MNQKIKIILKFLLVMTTILVVNSILGSSAFAHLPITDPQGIYKELPSPSVGEEGQIIAQKLVFNLLRYTKIIVAVIGILLITLMGFTMVTKADNEEEVKKAKTGLVYCILAFVLIGMSEEFGKMFDMTQKTIIGTPQQILSRVRIFDRQVELLVFFIKYIVGGIATLMIVTFGIKLVTMGGQEEEATKAKKGIMYSIMGLLMIYIGDIFINKVFYKVDKSVYSGITGVHPQIDAKAGVEQIVGITNFVVSFVGPLAVLMLIIGSVMYLTSGGEDEKMNKAKRLIFATVIGLVLIFGAFSIVSVVISGRLEAIGAVT